MANRLTADVRKRPHLWAASAFIFSGVAAGAAAAWLLYWDNLYFMPMLLLFMVLCCAAFIVVADGKGWALWHFLFALVLAGQFIGWVVLAYSAYALTGVGGRELIYLGGLLAGFLLVVWPSILLVCWVIWITGKGET